MSQDQFIETLPEDERRLVEGFRRMPPEQQQAFFTAVERVAAGDDHHEVADYMAAEFGWPPEKVAAVHKQIDEAQEATK